MFLLIAALFAVLVPRDVPVFAHDWAWPLTREQGAGMVRTSLSIWRDAGFGFRVVAPNGWFVTALIGAASYIATPYVALLVFLAALLALSAWGCSALMREFGLGDLARAGAAIAYAGSPVLLNKWHAGHSYYLVGFAMLPYACAWAIRGVRNDQRYAIAAGLALAICSSQLQFFVIGAFAVFVIAVALAGARAIPALAIAYSVALIAHLPDCWGMFDAARTARLFGLLPTTFFQLSLSVPVHVALAQFAYIGGYAQQPFGSALLSLEIAVDIAILTLVVAGALDAYLNWRASNVRALAAAATLLAAGVVLTAGYLGPLGSLERYLFSTFVLATAFREFYHFAALSALGTALAVGVALDAAPPIRALGGIAALVVCGAFAFALVRAPLAASPAVDAALRDAIVATPGRTLYEPGAPSLSVGLGDARGADSFQFQEGDAVPVTYTTDSARSAYWYGPGAGHVRNVASRFGWTTLSARSVVRDDYLAFLDPSTRAVVERGYRGNAPPAPGIQRIGGFEPLRSVLSSDDVLVGVPTWPAVEALPPHRHLVSLVPTEPPRFRLSDLGADPQRELAQSDRWLPAYDALSCLPMPSFFRLDGPRDPRAPCAWKYALDDGRECLQLDAGALQAWGPCATRGAGLAALLAGVARVRSRTARAYYVLEAFDPGWRLYCARRSPAAPNVLIDGYAAGWIVPACGSPSVAYEDDAGFQGLAAASFVALLALAVFAQAQAMRLRDSSSAARRSGSPKS